MPSGNFAASSSYPNGTGRGLLKVKMLNEGLSQCGSLSWLKGVARKGGADASSGCTAFVGSGRL